MVTKKAKKTKLKDHIIYVSSTVYENKKALAIARAFFWLVFIYVLPIFQKFPGRFVIFPFVP